MVETSPKNSGHPYEIEFRTRKPMYPRPNQERVLAANQVLIHQIEENIAPGIPVLAVVYISAMVSQGVSVAASM